MATWKNFLPELLQITHSGRVWTSLSSVRAPEFGFQRVPVWPIEEYLVRTKHSRLVAERIAKLNPKGTPEGLMPRGYHPKPTIRSNRFCMDVCDRKRFEKKWGRGTYRTLPKQAFVSLGGKRRGVSSIAYMQGPP